MKKVTANAGLTLAVLLGASFLLARTASVAAAPAPSPSQVVLSQWNEIGRKLVAMAEDFPEVRPLLPEELRRQLPGT